MIPLLSSLDFDPLFLSREGDRFPFQMSVDFRTNPYKFVPVDVNLFPSGWNNLCPHTYSHVKSALRNWFRRKNLTPSRVIILAEPLDRNPHYVENLVTISRILGNLGIEVRVAILDERVPREGVVWRGWKNEIKVEGLSPESYPPATRSGFQADWILSENDFTTEPPPWFHSVSFLTDNPPSWGWYRRRKHWFFELYHRYVPSLAEHLGLDPWHLTVQTRTVYGVDLSKGEGLEDLLKTTSELLEKIAEEYDTRGIMDRPYVVLKDNQGTFGRGVIAVYDIEDLKNHPRRFHKKLSLGKGSRPIRELIVQEGVPTGERVQGFPAELVGMTVGPEWIGGFYRFHEEKDPLQPLNAPGMKFLPLCPEGETSGICDPQREKVYSAMTRFVAWVTSQEIGEFLGKGEVGL